MKKTIGVLIFTKIGTTTSLLIGEFEFWNTFKKFNPDIEFVFIAVSNYTKKSILENREVLNFPVSIITVSGKEDFHKLHGLSGIFSYMFRSTFFGGSIDKPCTKAYAICSYCTNDLGIPLFLRTPDSEYPYLDYLKMIKVRINNNNKSTPKFIVDNTKQIEFLGDKFIDYNKTYFIANGSSKVCDWVQDVAYNDVPENIRIVDLETIKKNSIYVSDEHLHNVSIYTERYDYLESKSEYDKLLFIGYLKGSVAKGRIKTFNNMFSADHDFPPIDIIGPGANDIIKDNDNITLIDDSIFGTKFFETLNKYLGYIFIGKGNPYNKYINKTVYDCMSAKCPVIVYEPCDQNRLLFKNPEFYFTTPDELYVIYEKLKDPEIRNRWISEQKEDLLNVLKFDMDPMFSFSDYCESKKGIKPDLILKTALF